MERRRPAGYGGKATEKSAKRTTANSLGRQPQESRTTTHRIREADGRAWAEAIQSVESKRKVQIAGRCRTDFLLAPARMGHDSFQVNFDDLDRELARG